jgi:2-dehydro-3-deoxygalactonokinase
MQRKLLAVDWGTSSLRGALLNCEGVVLEKRAFPQGILQVAHGQFQHVFEQRFGDWISADTLSLISGMAGSRQGWREAPYCPCPSGFQDIAQHLQWIDKDRIGIVPGLSTWNDDTPDVMRGEEIQIFGALSAQQVQTAQFVLPGTHSKWAQVLDGKITSFKTFMTGEFYAMLSQHSILAKTCLPDAPLKKEVFLEGVMQSQKPGGLLHHAFSARSLALFEKLNPAQSSSYISGLLIGEEINSAKAHIQHEGTPLFVLGNGQLTQRYGFAMEALGLNATALADELTWSGLWALAHHLYPNDFKLS